MSNDKAFVEDCSKTINQYRKIHGVAPLKTNGDLTKIAQSWAENLAQRNVLCHSKASYKGDPLGENCFMMSSSDGRPVSANQAVESWYSEIKDYNFYSHSGSGSGVTGHFTQLVWKSSRELGVGKAVTRDGKTTMVVANFYPAGNYVGQHAENVMQPNSKSAPKPASQATSDSTKERTQSPGFLDRFFTKSPKSETTIKPNEKIIITTGRSTPENTRGNSITVHPIKVTGSPGRTEHVRHEVSSGPLGGQMVTKSYRQETVTSGGKTRTVTSQQVITRTQGGFQTQTFNQW